VELDRTMPASGKIQILEKCLFVCCRLGEIGEKLKTGRRVTLLVDSAG